MQWAGEFETMGDEVPQSSKGSESSTVETYPQFHLTFATDREATPKEVTIYPAGTAGDLTHWITADYRDTVAVDQIR
jgi:hypothetical protein